ncbi:MAG: MDR/zinc-dependent alcohol dehydrogenase-like family protein [Eisenbergiella sp.]
MKGIYYDGKDALYRENLPMPVCGANESLVKIHLAAVCNTDKEVRKGYKPDFTGVMGHEFVGEGVDSPDKSWMGKRVVGELNAACGKCIYCRTGRPTHCSFRRVLGMTDKDGCFAEYMTIDTSLLHEVPAELPDEIAIFTEPLAAALEILTQVHISPAKNAAVLGDGRLALMTAQVLALTGVDLTVVGRHPEKLELFKPFAKVTQQGEKEGYEYVVECTGSPTGLPTALELVRKKGTIILKSTYAGNISIDMSQVAVNEITITGSRCGPFEPALKLLKEEKVKLPAIELYDLSDFESAFSSKAFKAGFRL